MTAELDDPAQQQRRATTLAAIILVQAVCAVVFVADVVLDFSGNDAVGEAYLVFETIAALSLAAGVVLLSVELRHTLRRMDRMARGLTAARGDMAVLIERFFTDWGLTPSEREVALLLLKGLDNEEIARIRGTAAGTVRAQCARIYAKAQVDGRSQLFSVFMEELLHDGAQPARAGETQTPAAREPATVAGR